ncbi:DUF7388 family protein [Natronobiforma cellulositropha]|uniref:DUF7388 family protein n=1 Tax=Natronobiforma cellulositropha TaxID=1679076 RepID=UPI0021D5C056|nr:luciferase [Natronobiforma cellulositropha]
MLESPPTDGASAVVGLDALALKPTECVLTRAADAPVATLAVDYEGPEHVPDASTLETLARAHTVRLTVPVRADGFDPLGDNSTLEALPASVECVFVAGHPSYLRTDERRRAVAPRLAAALEYDPNGWVGTEGIERVALATGATQYELLTRTTRRDLRALRSAGFDADVAIYAPTVRSSDPDTVLDAVGAYVARRRPVAETLTADAPVDATASGRTREVLLEAAREYALVGTDDEIRADVAALKAAGATTVVGYPACGLASFL